MVVFWVLRLLWVAGGLWLGFLHTVFMGTLALGATGFYFFFFEIEDVARGALILLLPTNLPEKPVYASATGKRCRRVVETVQPAQTKKTTRRIALQRNPQAATQKTTLEVAVDPSYSNFFLEQQQKRLFWRQSKKRIAAGCITILQADRVKKLRHSVNKPYFNLRRCSRTPCFNNNQQVYLGAVFWRLRLLYVVGWL